MKVKLVISPVREATFQISHRSIQGTSAEFTITHHTIVCEQLLVDQEPISLQHIHEQSEYQLKNGTLIVEWQKANENEHWREQIMEVYKAFQHGWQCSKTDALKGMYKLQQKQLTEQRDLSQYPLVPMKQLKHCYYFLNIVMCSYGWTGINTFGHGSTYIVDFLRPKANKKTIREHLHLAKEHVLYYSDKVKWCHPAFFIIYDTTKHAIVVNIRGTFSVSDIITDFLCHYQPWKGGYAHHGMLKAAHALYDEIQPLLLQWCQQFNTQTIYFIGHSMGGSVGAFLSILVRDAFPELEVEAIAFGSQPIVTSNLLPLFKHCITVVNHNDFATRMSYSAMVKLRRDVHLMLDDALTDPVIPQMVLVGRVFWMHKHTNISTCKRIYKPKAHEPRLHMMMQEVDCHELIGMELDLSLTHHPPNYYEKSFMRCHQYLKEINP